MPVKGAAPVEALHTSNRGALFDAAYYRERLGPQPYERNECWLRFFGVVADQIVRSLRPARVFDAGCAMGILVESLWDRGVEAWGADVSSYAIGSVRPDMQKYCRLGSITEPFGGHYDLVTSIEVLEHMPEDDARLAIEQMSRATDTVLFSSTPDDFTEPTHINVHPLMYWLKLFGEYGFAPDLTYDAGFVCTHAILFRRVPRPPGHDVLASFAQLLRLKTSVADRDQRLAEVHDRISSLETSVAAETAARQAAENRISQTETENVQLRQAASDLKSELLEVRQSLGWRLVLRYRRWFSAARARSKWVDRWYEPLAARFVRRVAGPLPAPAPAQHEDPYEDWIRLNELASADLDDLEYRPLQYRPLQYKPKISIILPVYKVALEVLSDTIDSVLNQTYDHWELCIVHADPDAMQTRSWLGSLAASDNRIKLELVEENHGISGNSNRAFARSTGEFIALLDHDDTLAPSALFEAAARLNKDRQLDFIFSDKDQLSADGSARLDPLFKPTWSPDVMLSANYLTHFCVMRAETVRQIGGWRPETDGAQDWDLFLRAIDDPKRIAHIPKVLYHWRRVTTSCAAAGFEAKPYAAQAQLAAVQSHLDRQDWNAKAAFNASGLIQLRWNSVRRPSVSVILISNESVSGQGPLADARGSETSHVYRAAEVLVVQADETSLASRLNDAVRSSSGECVIFADQSVRMEAGLDEVVGPLCQPGIAVVGCKLLDPQTNNIRHAGICFNSDGRLAYPFASLNEHAHNVFGGANWYRNWLAVSGACFGIRRDVFDAVGGFSTDAAFPRLDVDLCLKIHSRACGRVLYNPFARMWQTKPAVLERWLRSDGPAMGAKYIATEFPDGDPFFNPNLIVREGRIGFRMTGAAKPVKSHYEGQLVRRPGTTPEDGKVYVVRHGRKHWVIDHRWAIQNGFRWPADVKTISAQELNTIPTGEPFAHTPEL